MSRNTTNLLGILIAIVAGSYLFFAYCSSCGLEGPTGFPTDAGNMQVQRLELPSADYFDQTDPGQAIPKHRPERQEMPERLADTLYVNHP